MPHGSSAYAGPQGLTFWADLQQHLTVLTVATFGNQGRVQHLEALSTLTALQRLSLRGTNLPLEAVVSPWADRVYCSLSQKRLTLKLPHLVSLQFWGFKAGALLLSCPKLADISVAHSELLRVKVENAALESLTLYECKPVQFALKSPETQLQKLKTLSVKHFSEVGRHLIQGVSQMGSLRKLSYCGFPAACLPSSFPQSLWEVTLCPDDWCLDLPEGLKELPELRNFRFDSEWRPWEITVPLARLLPVESLTCVQVGNQGYDPRKVEAKWKDFEEQTLGLIGD